MMGGGPFRPDRFGLLHRSVESVHFSDTVGSGFAGRAFVGATEAPPCFETVSDFDSSSSRVTGAAPRRGARASSGLGVADAWADDQEPATLCRQQFPSTVEGAGELRAEADGLRAEREEGAESAREHDGSPAARAAAIDGGSAAEQNVVFSQDDAAAGRASVAPR